MPSFSTNRTPYLFMVFLRPIVDARKTTSFASNFDTMKFGIYENVEHDYRTTSVLFDSTTCQLLLLMYKSINTTNQGLDAIQQTNKYD
jgi:hypothetical protein